MSATGFSFGRKLLFALGFVLFAQMSAFAQNAPAPINPTAQSVKEAQLLEELKPGAPISGRISIPDGQAANLMQSGRIWRAYHEETLPLIAAVAVLGMLAGLTLFYVVRGRIHIEAGPSLDRITRFTSIDRFAHWLSATSFMMLAVTGANVTLGKTLLLPVMGPEAFSEWAHYAKITHNYVGFAFMLGVALVFLVWVKDNIPDATDLRWFAAGGGLIGKGHPPAKRFNGGQKIVFWVVVLGGAMMSLSGWHLIFPIGNSIADMQWHATIHGTLAFIMLAIMLAHAYIGSVGMEGAFDAMSSGEVDLNWAKEHHSLWVEEEMARKGQSRISSGAAQPAE